MRISDWSSDVCSSDLGLACNSLTLLFFARKRRGSQKLTRRFQAARSERPAARPAWAGRANLNRGNEGGPVGPPSPRIRRLWLPRTLHRRRRRPRPELARLPPWGPAPRSQAREGAIRALPSAPLGTAQV